MLERLALSSLLVVILGIALSFSLSPTLQTSWSFMSPLRAKLESELVPFRLNRSLFNPALYSRIQHVWFEGLPADAVGYTEVVRKRWFPEDKETRDSFDGVCKSTATEVLRSIGPAHLNASDHAQKTIIVKALMSEAEHADAGLGSTRTAQSLLLLLDQIPRNIFRTKDTLPLVYDHYDKICISLLRRLLAAPASQRLDLDPSIRHRPVRRLWFYLPLMHSEDVHDHEAFEKILNGWANECESLGGEHREQALEVLKQFRKYEDQHVEIIRQFGRYPHRNAALGRQTTSEEQKWLDEGGVRFGVAEE